MRKCYSYNAEYIINNADRYSKQAAYKEKLQLLAYSEKCFKLQLSHLLLPEQFTDK